jgi:hypothetical protein
MEIATKPLVMASEISGLEPLHGFIKQENNVVPVHFQFAKMRGRQPEFIERKLPDCAQAVTADAGSSHRATQDTSSGPGHASTFRCAR